MRSPVLLLLLAACETDTGFGDGSNNIVAATDSAMAKLRNNHVKAGEQRTAQGQ